MRGGVIVLCCFAFLCSFCVRPSEIAPPRAQSGQSYHEEHTTPQWSRWELELDGSNVEATITTPSGKRETIGAFPSHGAMKLRYAPREIGLHRYVALSGGREVQRGQFIASPAPTAKGFVRRDPLNPHRLVDDQGSTVFVLGENRINVYDATWNHERASIAEYLERMRAYGMSTIRVFLFSDCDAENVPGRYQLGCLEPAIGRFDERTADAIDTIFDAAERTGIDVVLVAYAIGFTGGDETWRSWADNPYSTERGGPARTASDFFESPALREHAKRRLKYIADRWAASPRLLAVDLLNEPEWDGAIPERIWVPWGEAMSRAWRDLDPYDHLVTIGSVGLHWNIGTDERPWYGSAANDLVQWHLYGKEFYEPHALALEMRRKVEETWGFAKPVFCGEFAYGGEAKPDYEHTHDGIWSLLMSGAGALAHSAPPFEIDSDEPMTPERGKHFKVLADFLGSIDPKKALRPSADVRVSAAGARAWSLVTSNGQDRLVWILAGRENPRVENAHVTFPTSAPRLRVAWIDDVTGSTIASSEVAPANGEASLAIPTFHRHVAAKVTAH